MTGPFSKGTASPDDGCKGWPGSSTSNQGGFCHSQGSSAYPSIGRSWAAAGVVGSEEGGPFCCSFMMCCGRTISKNQTSSIQMLRKTLKGSESKEFSEAQDIPSLVPFGDVVGCLAVHIKRCRHFSPRINLQYYTNLFIRITINKFMKCTKAHSVNFKNNEKKPAIKFDEVKYFSVQVPRRQDDERNMIYLELMEFDELEAYPVLLGSFSLHLYEIIQKGCFTEEFFMKIRNLLKPLQKLIQPSMFMHIPPPVERTDPLTNVMTPQLIEYPAFLSPDLNVTIGTQPKPTQASSPVRLEKLQQQPRDRLDRMKKEYRNLKTWEEKSNYLDKILHMKTEKKELPDSQVSDSHEDIVAKSETPLPSSFLQLSELPFKKQEDKILQFELPVKTLEVKKSLPRVEMKAEPPDSSLNIQEDAETKNESLPPEESTPLSPVSLKEKDIGVEAIDDQLVFENPEPKEALEKEITDSTSLEVKPKQSHSGPERMDLIQSETKLKSFILSPEKRKKSTDESGVETKRQTLRQESRRSLELLREPREDAEAVTKMTLPRHVSFSFLREAVELSSSSDVLKKYEIEAYISLEEDKDKDERKKKYKSGVGENETDEENEIVIRNIYAEDYPFREPRPQSMPLFEGCQKTIIRKRGKFEPFLRNIIEIPIEENYKRIQNMPICTVVKKDTSNAEMIEHEDQDPPYAPTSSSLTENSENSSWDSNPDIFTIKSLDTEEMERGLSSLSLESFERQSTFTIDIDLVGKGQENLLSELSELQPSLEKLEKTMVLKSILNDDLKDLSEELFSKQGFLMEIEVEKEGQSLKTLDDNTLVSFKTDVLENAQNEIKTVHSEQTELSGKKSSSTKSSKKPLKIVQNEELSEFSGKKSSSSKSFKNDLKIVQSEQLNELSRKKSSSSRSFKNDIKNVQGEQLGELSGKTSSISQSSQNDLKIVQSEQLSELSGKTSSGLKSSKNDLKIVQSEQIELSGKTSSGSKSSNNDLKIVQSEQIELLGKTSSGSKSSNNDLQIVQSEQMGELSGKTSESSKSSFKNDLKIVQSKQLDERSVKTNSSSESFKNDINIVQNEQLNELGKMSSGSKSSKNDLSIVQGEQLGELSGKTSSDSESSANDLKVVQSEQTEVSENTNASSKSSENVLKIVKNDQSEISRKESLSSKSFSKEVLKDSPTESQIELTEEVEVEECHMSQTFDESEEQLSIAEGDLSSGRKHSFKKKHPEEYCQSSEEVIHSISVLSVAESFESPEDVSLIEQISSEGQITELDLESSVSMLDFPQSSLTVWDNGLASTSHLPHEKHSGVDLSKSKSYVRHIFLQAFPSDSSESGVVSVIELDKDYENPWLDNETSSPEEGPAMMEEGWKLSLKSSKNQFPQDKEEDLPQTDQLYTEKSFEEKELDSGLENASTSVTHKLSDSDRTCLKSFENDVFTDLSTENVTELGLPSGAEVEKENQTFFVPENEYEELYPNSTISMDKSDDFNAKPVTSPNYCSFEEYLSGSEAEHLKANFSKYIQNFLVKRLSESGPFPKEDLPKIFESLYLINDKKELPISFKIEIPPKEQNNFKDFPETSQKSMPSVNNSNCSSFDDKHLEIRLRALLSEILHQYILNNHTETKLIRERESENRYHNLPPYRTKTVPPFSHEVRHDYPERSFSGESELNKRSPLSQSIQDLLSVISENEILNLKSDFSQHLQSLFIERLSNMGLITEKEFHNINESMSSTNSSDRPLKFLSSDLRGLNQCQERPSEKQSYKAFPRHTSQEVTDERLSNIELARKLEREYFTLHNIKRRSSLVREDERQYIRERVGKHGLTGVKASRKSSQEFLFNNSSERITKLVLRREQKDHNLMRLPQVEKNGFQEEIQDLHGWYNRPKTSHSKGTLKIKPLGKKEHINIYKVTVKEKPESVFIPCVQNSEVQPEIKEYLYKSKLSSSSNTYAYLNSDDEEKSNLKDQCYGKSKETNKKKPLLTVTQFHKELQAVRVKAKETATEKCATTPQSFDHSRIVDINNSKPSIFPEVLKTENLKSKLRRERDYVEKQKRPLYRTAKILAASQPATRLLLRKSSQRTLLFPWAGKRNLHDSSENKKEDLHVASFKHLEKAKARARFDLGRSPDNNQCTFKNLARPNTAPEFNKRLKESFGKFTSPRVVSAGLSHVNAANPGLEERHQKKDLKDLEKCSVICDILQLLNSSYVKRKYEDDY
uniref:Amyotrophic lateral sclerosis 2 chromosomal region candidate gene 11 protein isoform X3 n=1 Tax=Phascolarctos cinereus TaxID=38626 RepID=A0A6P5J5A0_PHACI|nr:amyotrophic lateral sclerosis 2 chromosomal region candidate gene 11 protein isoform X3 [Phascolarctos cinereus]